MCVWPVSHFCVLFSIRSVSQSLIPFFFYLKGLFWCLILSFVKGMTFHRDLIGVIFSVDWSFSFKIARPARQHWPEKMSYCGWFTLQNIQIQLGKTNFDKVSTVMIHRGYFLLISNRNRKKIHLLNTTTATHMTPMRALNVAFRRSVLPACNIARSDRSGRVTT